MSKKKVEAPKLTHTIVSQVKENYQWGTLKVERNCREDGSVLFTVSYSSTKIYRDPLTLDAGEARMLVKLLNALVGPIEIGE